MTEQNKPLTISVFGLGYVGCVSAACLARDGHSVIGVDISPVKLEAINRGEPPVDEPGLAELVSQAVRCGRLRTTTDVEQAIVAADVSLICVGTPSHDNGSLSLDHVERVCQQIGKALAKRERGHIVVVRSTMLPGSMDRVVRRTLEESSGLCDGEQFFTAINPEFLRESSAIADYDHPPKIVIGTAHRQAAEVVSRIYAHLPAPLIVTSPQVAEMVKYSDNVWHAVKIAFGNEIGEVCRQIGVDSHDVMDIFLQDKHLNISPVYLRPGFAFGGSCLPKDLRALTYFCRHHDLELPLLQSVMVSNNARVEGVVQRILRSGARNVGLYGLSFKRHTDDLRESPFVALAERLIGKGINLRIYDESIQLDRLTGANKEYIGKHIPHLVNLLVKQFDGFDDFAELVVIGHHSDEASAWVNRRAPGIRIIDLARLSGVTARDNYEGVSW